MKCFTINKDVCRKRRSLNPIYWLGNVKVAVTLKTICLQIKPNITEEKTKIVSYHSLMALADKQDKSRKKLM